MSDNAIAVLVPALLFTTWLGGWGISNWIRYARRSALLKKSSGWIEVSGRIKESTVAWAHVAINYEYDAPDGNHTGKHEVSLPVTPFGSLPAARNLKDKTKSIMATFAPKQSVPVRYNPDNPKESVLITKE